jgi:hypothetical protein
MILAPEFLSKFVGVVEPTVFGDGSNLKRLLLLFERIALDLSQRLTNVERAAMRAGRRDLDYLISEGLVTTLAGIEAEADPYRDEDFRIRRQREEHEYATLTGLELVEKRLSQEFRRLGHVDVRLSGLAIRKTAAHLRTAEGVDAVAVTDAFGKLSIDAPADRDFVIKLTLQTLPVPSDLTPWEDILSFKSDPASTAQFFRLKRWINRLGREGLAGYEAIDELKTLLAEYEAHMRTHRIKASRGTMEVLVTTPAEIAEDLIKLKLGKLAKAPFDVARARATLLQAEQDAPGREIAYIVSANRRFN